MTKSRLEAFSDGVLAVIITIMVLELKAPEGDTLADLRPLIPGFLSYILSFIYVGIYWNNHHHMLQLSNKVNGSVLWSNLHLLFWLSLIPFTTNWMDESEFKSLPVAVYGGVLLMCGLAYVILEFRLIKAEGEHSKLAKAVAGDIKGKMSVVLYAIAIAASFYRPWISLAIYALVAIMWFIPDKRIERFYESAGKELEG